MNLDNTSLNFGKYKGMTPKEVGDIDPSYIVWMYDNVKPAYCSKGLYEACRMDQQEYEEEKMDDMAHYAVPMPLQCDASEAGEEALTAYENFGKEPT